MQVHNIPDYYNNKDSISFKSGFTNLEKSIMKEMVEYSQEHGVETLRILKNGKDITHKFTIIEAPKRCDVKIKDESKVFGINLGKLGKYINNILYFRNTVQFHTHPKELPLGPQDIKSAIAMKMAKTVAVTPSGRYSAMTIGTKQRRKARRALYLFDEWFANMQPHQGKDKSTLLKIVQTTLTDTLNKFAQKTGTKYESNIEIQA